MTSISVILSLTCLIFWSQLMTNAFRNLVVESTKLFSSKLTLAGGRGEAPESVECGVDWRALSMGGMSMLAGPQRWGWDLRGEFEGITLSDVLCDVRELVLCIWPRW